MKVSDITRTRIDEALKAANAPGLRCYRLQVSNFRDEIGEEPVDLLDLHESTLAVGEDALDAVAAEVLLKEGVPLDAKWHRSEAGGARVIVANGVAVILSLEISDHVAGEALALGARVVVFLEDGFAGADAVKANAVTNAKNLGIALKTV